MPSNKSKFSHSPNGRTKQILGFLRAHGAMTYKDVAGAVDISFPLASVYLAQLQRDGRVRSRLMAGSKRKRVYYWISNLTTKQREKRREKVMQAVGIKVEKRRLGKESPAIRRLRREGRLNGNGAFSNPHPPLTPPQPQIHITIIASASQAEQILHRINKT